MERLGVSDLYDPYGNILVATDYLVELFEKHGDIGLSLMIYNMITFSCVNWLISHLLGLK